MPLTRCARFLAEAVKLPQAAILAQLLALLISARSCTRPCLVITSHSKLGGKEDPRAASPRFEALEHAMHLQNLCGPASTQPVGNPCAALGHHVTLQDQAGAVQRILTSAVPSGSSVAMYRVLGRLLPPARSEGTPIIRAGSDSSSCALVGLQTMLASGRFSDMLHLVMRPLMVELADLPMSMIAQSVQRHHHNNTICWAATRHGLSAATRFILLSATVLG